MPNLWPEKFEPNTQAAPIAVLGEQSKYLPTLTDGLVFAETVELSGIDAIGEAGKQGDFKYAFNIVGKFLDGYKFRVMTLAHDIALYPVEFKLDRELAKEILERTSISSKTTIDSPESLLQFLKAVFASKRLKSVIGTIMSLSRK